jgi:hypothetical protein
VVFVRNIVVSHPLATLERMNDAEHELARLAAEQHGIFTHVEARKSGLTDRQIERRVGSDWEQLYEGVYRVRGTPVTFSGELLAASLNASEPVGISRRAAAFVYGTPGPKEWVELTCRRWKRTRVAGPIVHESTRFDEQDVTVLNRVPIVTPERLVFDVATITPFPDSIERVIQSLRRKRLITYSSVFETYERLHRRGVKGMKALRIALERWDPTSQPTESDMETWLAQAMRANGLTGLVTQFVVRDKRGVFIARTDGALPDLRITIEYQSKQEHLDEFQSLADDRRRNAILAAGYFPLAARVEDLRAGGHLLVQQIHEIAATHAMLRT